MSNDFSAKSIPFTKKKHNAPYSFISPTRPELSCAGRNVVVTGGATGIGLAIAIGFAQAGAKSVTIISRTLETLRQGVATIAEAADKEATKVMYQVADTGEPDQITAALSAVVDKVGKIDVLVANAAGAVLPGAFDQVDPKDLLLSLQQNVIGALNLVQAFLPLAGPEPIILNTSSCMAHWIPLPNSLIYTLTKAAALKLFDMFAIEHPHVHVVNVQPGYVATALNGYAKGATDSPELPGHFYVWLASPEAKFLKGKFVWTNWDAPELVERADEIANSNVLTTLLEGVPV